MMFYTVLIYLVIAIIGNGIFYFACGGEYDSCSIVSSVFFNIAVLCQILPIFINKVEHEKNQRNGQTLICSLYLLAVIILCLWSISGNISYVTSGIIQLIILGIFLTVFLSVAKANEKTTRELSQAKFSRSSSLMEAKAHIRSAIATNTSSEQKEILREVSSELNSMAINYDSSLAEIDSEILGKVKSLCDSPDKSLKSELSQLIQKRISMTLIINQ